MNSIFPGGAVIALGLISTVASGQMSATTTSAASFDIGGDIATRTAVADQAMIGAAPSTVVDMKRATRKSRRDVSIGTGSGATIDGSANAHSSTADRSPGGGL